MSPFSSVLFLAMVGVGLWCFVRVLRRAGRSGWWSLAMFLPGINIILVWVFSYARWPAVDYAHEFEGENRYMPPGATRRRRDSADAPDDPDPGADDTAR